MLSLVLRTVRRHSKRTVTKKSAGVNGKSVRDPERTSANLLRAGVEIFSSSGYAGAAVEDIVNRAGCNKRMLYHYYGNKEGLYSAVLREVFSRLELMEVEAVEGAEDLPHAIRSILSQYFEFLQNNPDFVNLVVWENLNGGKFLDEHPGLLSKAPILEKLRTVLDSARGSGCIRSLPDTRHLLVLLIGVCFIYFSNRHTLRHSVGLDLARSSVLKEGLAIATDVILNGILNKPVVRPAGSAAKQRTKNC